MGDGEKKPCIDRRRPAAIKVLSVILAALTGLATILGGMVWGVNEIKSAVTNDVTTKMEIINKIDQEKSERIRDDMLQDAKREALKELVVSRLDTITAYLKRDRGN